MKTKCWLIINDNGKVTSRAKKPTLDTNEVAVFLEINIPDALFIRPRLKATVTIPEESVLAEEISADVTENVAQLIKENMGLNLDIKVEYPEE